jgi:hypothetical protein
MQFEPEGESIFFKDFTKEQTIELLQDNVYYRPVEDFFCKKSKDGTILYLHKWWKCFFCQCRINRFAIHWSCTLTRVRDNLSTQETLCVNCAVSCPKGSISMVIPCLE